MTLSEEERCDNRRMVSSERQIETLNVRSLACSSSLIFSAFSHLVSQNDKVIKGLPNLLPP